MENDLNADGEQEWSPESSETPENSDSSWKQRAERALSLPNIALLFVVLGLIVFVGVLYSVSDSGSLTFTSKSGIVYLSTVFLLILYTIVLGASVVYRYQVMYKYKEEFDEEKKMSRSDLRRLTSIFAIFFLPFVSILLVITAQIISVDNTAKNNASNPSNTERAEPSSPAVQSSGKSESADSKKNEDLPYRLAFYFSSSVIVLLIGMEVSYSVQEHSEGHQWPVLVMASLILDFISYFLIVAGHQRPGAVEIPNITEKACFTFLLGLGSMISSYYTVAYARITDETLGLAKKK